MISGWGLVVLLSKDCGKLLYERSILECKKKYDHNFTYDTLQEILQGKKINMEKIFMIKTL